MIVVILGVPGAGKTTLQAHLAKKAMKKKKNVWSNVYIEGCYMLDHETDLNINLIENGVVLIDEGGTVLDNRSWKTMSKRIIRWYKMHRHYNTDVYITSQDYDIDAKVRALTKEIWVVSKSIIPYFVAIRKIKTKIGISETETEIVQVYKWRFFLFGGLKLVYMPSVWHMFDTHYRDILHKKDFLRWTKANEHAFTYDFTKDETLIKFK